MCTGNFLVLEAVEDNLVDDYVWYREGVITLPSRTPKSKDGGKVWK